MKGDPLSSQNHDALKSSKVGPTNKIFFQSFFQTKIFFSGTKKNFQGTTYVQFFMYCKAKKNFGVIRKILIFKNHKVNWDPPRRISIHRDFDILGGPLSPCGSH